MATWETSQNGKKAPYFALEYKLEKKPKTIVEELVKVEEKTIKIDEAVTKTIDTYLNSKKIEKIEGNYIIPPKIEVNGKSFTGKPATTIKEFCVIRTNGILGNGYGVRKGLWYDLANPHILTSNPVSKAPNDYSGIVSIRRANKVVAEWTPANGSDIDTINTTNYFDNAVASDIKDRVKNKGAIQRFPKNYTCKGYPGSLGAKINGDDKQRIVLIRQPLPAVQAGSPDNLIHVIVEYWPETKIEIDNNGNALVNNSTPVNKNSKITIKGAGGNFGGGGASGKF